jgi:hypothetical protein
MSSVQEAAADEQQRAGGSCRCEGSAQVVAAEDQAAMQRSCGSGAAGQRESEEQLQRAGGSCR